MVETTAATAGGRYFPETGCVVDGAFLDFFNRYGVEMCGLPITERLVENGAPTQYFQRLALAEDVRGQVVVKALGSEVLARRMGQPVPVARAADVPLSAPPFALAGLVSRLPRHASLRYETRPLSQIAHLVVHHSGVPAEVGVEAIAGYHVADLNWPGIGYHFVVAPDGHIDQTNALSTVSYHVRQFNPVSVGIALLGDFDTAPPGTDQLEATAALCAWLRRELGLPLDAIQGHRELVSVTCPGSQWLTGAAWKYDLLYRVQRLLGETPVAPPVVVAESPSENGAVSLEVAQPTEAVALDQDVMMPSASDAAWRVADSDTAAAEDATPAVNGPAEPAGLRDPLTAAEDVDAAASAAPDRPA